MIFMPHIPEHTEWYNEDFIRASGNYDQFHFSSFTQRTKVNQEAKLGTKQCG